MAETSTTPYDGLCPWCKAPMSVGALLCVKCGYHLKLRAKVSVEAEPQLATVRDPANPYRSPGLRVSSTAGRISASDTLHSLYSKIAIRGRMPRWQWWVFQLAMIAVIAMIGTLKEHQLLPDLLMGISTPIFLGTIIYSHAKRWHDLNHSAWWVLLHVIPMGSLYTFIVLGFQRGSYGLNDYGPDPFEH